MATQLILHIFSNKNKIQDLILCKFVVLRFAL